MSVVLFNNALWTVPFTENKAMFNWNILKNEIEFLWAMSQRLHLGLQLKNHDENYCFLSTFLSKLQFQDIYTFLSLIHSLLWKSRDSRSFTLRLTLLFLWLPLILSLELLCPVISTIKKTIFRSLRGKILWRPTILFSMCDNILPGSLDFLQRLLVDSRCCLAHFYRCKFS